MEQGEVVRIGGIEMWRALDRSELVRLQAHDREAAFEEIEGFDVECAGDELRGVAARALNVSVGVRVGPSDHAPYAGIVIAFERWEGRERIGNCGNGVAVAAEVVDHDDGAL